MLKQKRFVLLVALLTVFVTLFSLNPPTELGAQTVNDPLVDLAGSLSPDLGTNVNAPNINLATTTDQVAIVLAPRNEALFEATARNIQNPASPQYRKILSQSDYLQQFAPETQVVDYIKDYFKGKGLTLKYESADRLLLTVSGTASQLDNAFGTRSESRINAQGENGLINVTPLKLPAPLATKIKGVTGFDRLHKPQLNQIPPVPQAATSGSNTAASLRTAYNIGATNLTGQGTTVAITLWGAPSQTDLARWTSAYGQPLNLTVIGNATPAASDGVRIEANMDVQLVQVAAPQAAIRFYVGASATFADMQTALSQAINDNVTAISNSWGTCESSVPPSTIDAYHTVFASAAVKGTAVFFSSGDSGVFQCSGTGYSSFPSGDDLVTSVGGTRLTRDDATNAWQTETGWSCSVSNGTNDGTCLQSNSGSSGGGITINYPRPSYQGIAVPTEAKFSYIPASARRVQPDLSMDGDPQSGIPVFFIGFNGLCNDNCLSGGTSASSPLMAGIAALAAQRAGQPVGGFNPFIYANYQGAPWLYDVTTGYNGVNAKSGWDYVTGLGSLKDAKAFVDAFTTPPPVRTITTSAGTPQSAPVSTAFGTALKALVKDEAGNPVSGVSVLFSVPASGATASFSGSAQVTTGADGIATAPTLTANCTAGSYTVTASVTGAPTPASFSLTNTSGTASTIVASAGSGQSTIVSTAFNTLLKATVKDSCGNGVGGVTVTFTAPASGASGSFASSPTVTTDAAGVATAPSFTANATTGSYTVTATATGVATSATFNLSNLSVGSNPSLPVAYQLNPSHTGAIAMPGFGPTLKTKWSVDLGGQIMRYPIVAGGKVFVAVKGTNAADELKLYALDPTSGQILWGPIRSIGYSYYDMGIAYDNGKVFSVNDARMSAIDAATGTLLWQYRAPLAQTWSLGPVTAYNGIVYNIGTGSGALNAFRESDGTLLWSVPTGNGDNSAPLVTDEGVYVAAGCVSKFNPTTGALIWTSNSVCSFGQPTPVLYNNRLYLHRSNDTIAVLDSATGQAVSFQASAITTPAFDSGIGYFVDGKLTARDTTSGATLWTATIPNQTLVSPPIVSNGFVYAVSNSAAGDVYGFDITNGNQVWHGTLGGTVSWTSAAGQGILVVPAGQKLVAFGSGAGFKLTAPASAVTGTAFNLTVTAQDASGNTDTAYTGTIHFTSTDNQATLPTDYTFVAGDNGTHTFSLTLRTPGNQAITVTDTANSTLNGSTVVLVTTPPPGTITAVDGTPQSASVGTAFTTRLKAQVKDLNGNPLSGINVTFAAPNSGASGSFSTSAVVATDANGFATAPTFTANCQAGSYNVTATVSGINTPANFALTNTPGTPASLTATAGAGQRTVVNTAFLTSLQATVKDGCGNLVGGASVTFSAPGSGASGTFPSNTTSASATTNTNGVATAPLFTANGTAGSYNVTASVSGIANNATFVLTNLPVDYGSFQPSAYQINPAHNGAIALANFEPGLKTKWSVDLGNTVSYPVVGEHKVFVTTTKGAAYGTKLYALDAATGQIAWGPVDIPGTYSFSNAAYDNGKVFVINYNGVMQAFDASNGALLWSKQMPGQYSFTSPPSALNGIVYTGGAGSGGTVYAVRETDGTVLWTASVANGDDSSPAVTDEGVYVSYACQQDYKFNPGSGALIWHHTTGCSGGGGRTSVYYNGRLYTRDDASSNSLILDATTGTELGSFAAQPTPAFSNGTGFFVNNGGLEARNAATQAVIWSASVAGNPFVTAPIVINGNVYVGTAAGDVYAFDAATGSQSWHGNAGAGIKYPDEHNATLLTGLGAGEGLLFVPASNKLVAFAPDAGLRITAPANATAGIAFNITVTAKDAAGNTNTGYTGTAHFVSSDTQAVLPSDYTFTAADNGTHSFSVTLKTSGNQTLTAIDTAVAGQSGQATIAVAPASPATITASSGVSQTAMINTTFSIPLQATVKDSFGNLISGVSVTFQATTAPGGATGTFPGPSSSTVVPTANSGVATAPAFKANGTVGNYTVTASVSGVATSAVFNMANAESVAPSGQSVAYQFDTMHSGALYTPNFNPPLTAKWTVDLGGAPSYPLLAEGKVFIITTGGAGTRLYALNVSNGQIAWGPLSIGSGWAAAAYEAGRVFVVNSGGLMSAYEAATGNSLWVKQLPGQWSFDSPPTARNGLVYTGGAGGGGTLYALRESDGTLMWTASVANGNSSSPAVSDDGVYVSYACPNVYKFNPTSGALIWGYFPGCSGGGGATPILYNGRLYVRDWASPGIVLDSNTGQPASSMAVQGQPPAFDGGVGFFVNNGILEARNASTSTILWSKNLSGIPFVTPAVVVNAVVYIGGNDNKLYGFNPTTGAQVWSGSVGNTISGAGMAAGESLLVVPAGNGLVAFGVASGYSSTPAPGSTIDLGSTPLGIGVTANLPVTALGSSDLSLSNPSFSGANAADFAITSPASFPVTIAGGANKTLTLSCTPGAAGLRSATLTLTTTDPLQPTVSYSLKCTGMLVVISATDNGKGDTPGTLSYLLKNRVSTGQTISFALPANGHTITLSGLLPSVPAGVTIDGGSCSSPLVLEGVQAGKGDGLVLQGKNILKSLTLTHFNGRQLVSQTSGNRLSCVVMRR